MKLGRTEVQWASGHHQVAAFGRPFQNINFVGRQNYSQNQVRWLA